MAFPTNVPDSPRQLQPLCYPCAELLTQTLGTVGDFPGSARTSVVNAGDDAGGHARWC